MYCVNENKDAKAHFGFFFNFSFCHSYITHMDVFVRVFSTTTLLRIMKLFVYFQVGEVCFFKQRKMNKQNKTVVKVH